VKFLNLCDKTASDVDYIRKLLQAEYPSQAGQIFAEGYQLGCGGEWASAICTERVFIRRCTRSSPVLFWVTLFPYQFLVPVFIGTTLTSLWCYLGTPSTLPDGAKETR
jgi:hypothetical protein